MAYIRELKKMCSTCGKKPATHEVFNKYNVSVGVFCKTCADKRVKSFPVV